MTDLAKEAVPPELEIKRAAVEKGLRGRLVERLLADVRSGRNDSYFAAVDESLAAWLSRDSGIGSDDVAMHNDMTWLMRSRCLVWCARAAARQPRNIPWDELSGPIATGLPADVPHDLSFWIEEREQQLRQERSKENPMQNGVNERFWLVDCLRYFHDSIRSHATPTVTVPVALHQAGSKQGVLATLHVSIVDGGHGNAFLHPLDVLSSGTDDSFRDSMRDAFVGAGRLAAREGMTSQFDGRWSLRGPFDVPFTGPTDGRSASGAAARAWYFLLTGKKPDDGIVTFAAVNELDFESLDEVASVDIKIKALVDSTAPSLDALDTIVVAGELNHNAAVLGLADRGFITTRATAGRETIMSREPRTGRHDVLRIVQLVH